MSNDFTLKQPIPILQAPNLAEAIAFYEQLGFGNSWIHEEFYAGTERDGQHLHLVRAAEPVPSSLYCIVDNADAAYELAVSLGVEIVKPIGNEPYGMRDFYMKDPWGNSLGFASELSE
jgi:uncharacterized glyoxalase superfamily protein PhnB